MRHSIYDKQDLAKMVLEGIPYEKIANEYGVSPSTVKKRVHDLKLEGYIPIVDLSPLNLLRKLRSEYFEKSTLR